MVRSGKILNDLSWAALWPLNELLCRPIKTRRICVCIAVCISVRAVCIPVCIRSSTHHNRCIASSGGASGSRIVGPAQLPEQQHTRTKIPGGATTIHQHQKFWHLDFSRDRIEKFLCAEESLRIWELWLFVGSVLVAAGAFVYAELRSRSSLQTINRGKGHVWMFGQRRRCDLISSTGRQFLIRS